MPDTPPPADATEAANRLVEAMRMLPSVAVALSGGVDSAVVAAAAVRALGRSAVALTAHSPSVSRRDRIDAAAVTHAVGIRQVVVETDEFALPDYQANRGDRCYYCKSTLYDAMAAYAEANGFATLCNGTNADDLGDYRPGLRAASEFAVRQPLAELGYGKRTVREIAALWSLPIAEKPASPCLSSRVAVGVAVTPELTARIERAEECVRKIVGDGPLRVRVEVGDLARIEVPKSQLFRLVEQADTMTAALRRDGFRAVTLDLEGFRSGSLNDLVPLHMRTAEASR